MVRRVPIVPCQPEARLVLARHDRYIWRTEPRTTGGPSSPARRGARPDHRRVLPAPVLPQAARPQLGEPAGPRGGLRDDAVVGRPGRRRVPHGRHQPHLEARWPPTASRRCCSPTDRGCTSSSRRCTARYWPGVTCSPSGRRRARTSRTPAATPIRPGAEIDMVFTFEHVHPGRGVVQVGPAPAAARRAQGSTSRRGRTGSPTSAGTRCTGTTTTSPASSPAGATTRRAPGGDRQVVGDRAAPAPGHARTSTRARSWA